MEEISLSSIVMKKGDGSRVWYPVAKLISNPLSNLSRGDNRCDKLQACPTDCAGACLLLWCASRCMLQLVYGTQAYMQQSRPQQHRQALAHFAVPGAHAC